MKKTLLFSFLAISFAFKPFAQSTKLEKLWNGKEVIDTLKIQDILDFGTNIQSTSMDSALLYYNWAIELIDRSKSQKSSSPRVLKALKKLKATSLRYIGIVYFYEGKYDLAIDYFFNSLKILEEINDKIGISLCLGNIGAIHVNLGNFEKALEYFEKLLETFEELGDKANMGACYNNIGAIHQHQKNFNSALEYYQLSLQIFEELGDSNRISDCYSNIGLIKVISGEHSDAIEFYKKALNIYKLLGDTNGESTIYCSIANLHITIADSSAKASQKKINNLNLAIEFGTKSIELARRIKSFPLEGHAALALMNAYKKSGNAKQALMYAEIFMSTKDSMYSEEKTKALAEVEAKYEAKKKQQEIENKHLIIENNKIESSRQRTRLNLFISGSFLLGLLVLVAIFAYRQKHKINLVILEKNALLEQYNEEINATSEALRSQNDQLTSQNNEITKQRNEIEVQKNDLANIAWELQERNEEVEAQGVILMSQNKEITDSIIYAQRIQSALLPSQQVLNELLPNNFVLFKPKSIVSGDFYWATSLGRWTIFCVADCTGHGVPGAFMSMLGISFLNEIVRKEKATNPAEILNEMRSLIVSSLNDEGIETIQVDGMEMAICVVDNHTLKLNFAGANLPCWIIPANQSLEKELIHKNQISEKISIQSILNSRTLIELLPNRMPLSRYQKMDPFELVHFQLSEGDTIYLMSDGFKGQFGGYEGKKFQTRQLKEIIASNSNFSLDEQLQRLNYIFESWRSDKNQVDDVTIMGVKF